MGYLKVSLSIMGENDKNVELAVEPLSSITSEKKCLMSANIERKTYQLSVEIYYGRNIKPCDGGAVDSYVGVEFGRIYEKTDPISKNVNPDYMKKVYVPMGLPAVTESIALRLLDMNLIYKTELIGSHYVNINRLLKEFTSEAG